MTPDRLQEIRQRLDSAEFFRMGAKHLGANLYVGEFLRDITDLLAALATAEAEGRRQEQATFQAGFERGLAEGRQLLPEREKQFGCGHCGMRFDTTSQVAFHCLTCCPTAHTP